MKLRSADWEKAYEAALPVFQEAIHALLTNSETREIFAACKEGDYLNNVVSPEEWRICVSTADLADRLNYPKTGWTKSVGDWLTIPVVAIARRAFVRGNEFIDDAWSQVVLKDAIIPRSVFDDPEDVHSVLIGFFLHKPRHLSTLIAPWTAYASSLEFTKNAKNFDEEGFDDEESLSAAEDALYPHFVHYGVVAGFENLALIPHLMAARNVDVTDPQSIRSSIAATKYWRERFAEYQ
ncbi:hypothetical protein J7394_22680 [Ruegeria sp. R13_0]|uniref:hypothetical protein n=1 Tax=Ruegeria sp. R13_0 TaxID=2821099 RepID=UPI001ADCBE40|nr:hypothetical protein [Ruegeria sp. R13_0]MBO9437012.1 hypothetical protein [Ruegeria sp. R13_0]